MNVDKIDEKVNEEVVKYKCPNPNCENYGYKENKA